MSRPLSQLFDLRGKVALITGGSRGLGLQIAEALGEYGAHVVLTARKAADLAQAAEQLQGLGVATDVVAGDLRSEGEADRLVETVLGRRDRIDILVNNAGATWGAPAEDHPTEAWDKVMDLNVKAVFLLTRAVARRAFLPRGGGSVVNVASIEGLVGHHPSRIGTLAYNTSKAAVIGLTRTLAAEWGPRNIRVNAIAPGFFPSKMTTWVLDHHGAFIVEQTPLGKLGGDNDLKGPVLLLASEAGGHMTGQVLVVDGGFTSI